MVQSEAQEGQEQPSNDHDGPDDDLGMFAELLPNFAGIRSVRPFGSLKDHL